MHPVLSTQAVCRELDSVPAQGNTLNLNQGVSRGKLSLSLKQKLAALGRPDALSSCESFCLEHDLLGRPWGQRAGSRLVSPPALTALPADPKRPALSQARGQRHGLDVTEDARAVRTASHAQASGGTAK